MKLSDIYKVKDDLLLLHGINKDRNVLSNDISSLSLYIKIDHFLKPKYSSFFIKMNSSFEPFMNCGIILKDADLIAASKDDGGFNQDQGIIKEESQDKISETINDISNCDLSKCHCDILISNPVAAGLYFISDPYGFSFNHADYHKAQEENGIDKVYGINTNGHIYEATWDVNKYSQLKTIKTRKEIIT